VPTTSIGRLFDVVSSMLGVRHRIDYEAQAAIELEVLAEAGRAGAVTLSFEWDRSGSHPGVIDPRPLLAGLVDGLRGGARPADLALAFHVAVADMIGRVADHHARDRQVALTGGVFQNALLSTLTRDRLERFEVLTHRLVPTNDGGLALGQAVVAAARLRETDEEE
jgi:hydrogenase maturation protein HypF